MVESASNEHAPYISPISNEKLIELKFSFEVYYLHSRSCPVRNGSKIQTAARSLGWFRFDTQ